MNPTYRTWLIAGATVVIVLAALVIVPRYHYTAVKLDNGTVYIIDNFTGKTKGVSRGVMFDVEKKEESVTSKHKSRQLTAAEKENIIGCLKHQSRYKFGGSVYNGNSRICITSLKISIETRMDTTRGIKVENMPYIMDTYIPPLTTRYCEAEILPDDTKSDYRTWFLESATGYDVDPQK